MTNIYELPVKDLFASGIIALICDDGSKHCQLLYSRSMMVLLARVTTELQNNKYTNRVIQDAANAGQLDVQLVEAIDVSEYEGAIKDLYLRHKMLDLVDRLNREGYKIINPYNTVKLEAKVACLHRRRAPTPQVVVKIARGTKYYVQKLFNTIAEAEAYIACTSIETMLQDTKGIVKPFKVMLPEGTIDNV